MNKREHRNDRDDARDIAQLLGAAGAREKLPEELKARWEDHFRAELQPILESPRRGFLLPLVSLAASVVVLLLVLDFFAGEPAASTPMQVTAVTGGGQLILDEQRRLAAVAGQNLSAGVTLETAAQGRVALSWGGFDVRLNHNSRLTLMNDHLELTAGEVYVSNFGRRTSHQRIVVKTPLAAISDIGTQFKVRLTADAVISSVRRGGIVVRTETGEHRAEAAPEHGRTLVVGADNTVSVSEDDSDWGWIYAVARRFDLEGRSVHEFLQWSVSESGRQLSFADESVALAARNTRFSGGIDLPGVNPDRAVAVALSTTRFIAEEQRDGSLLISRRSE